jgi:hypothetical protein
MPRLDPADIASLTIALVIVAGTLVAPRIDEVGLIDLSGESLCLSQQILAVECPGCGLTRSTVAMGRWDLRGAVALNWLAPAIFILASVHLVLRTTRLVVGRPYSLRSFDLATLVAIVVLFVVRTIGFYLV